MSAVPKITPAMAEHLTYVARTKPTGVSEHDREPRLYVRWVPLGWTFGGENAMARVEVIDSFPFIEGVVMPVRWDLERNAPWVDPAATDAESDA